MGHRHGSSVDCATKFKSWKSQNLCVNPGAGSYAPVTVLIDERADGVHLSYDKMAGFLAPYGNLAAQRVAGELGAKVETLLRAAAG